MNVQSHISVAESTLAEYLRKRKMRCTQERKVLLECVMGTDGHFTIDDFSQKLHDSGFHVSIGTLYNTLQLFVDCGLLRSLRFGSDKTRYERVQGTPNHHHLVCTQCGRVKETRLSDLSAMIENRNLGKFTPAYYTLTIYGICARCRRAKNSSKNKK
ncbi:MAG: transcriptional repressor [Muribaculaceae bacterium]|nr:transcriptional repressor [Muribaculaceae bacterium]